MLGACAVLEDDCTELDPLIGRALDERWMAFEPMARGGMGTVYRGAHVELGRQAAIKVLSPACAKSEEAVERFLREARIASQIDHPNIVAILDLGRLETGVPYLVMELLEGEDLADLIAREAPVPVARVVELLEPIARALDAVHAAGLLHRDVKPANIFLARRPDGRVAPTLIDFGLAALREEGNDRRLTREGIVVGTPHYVSPEAAEGEKVDARSDVYSLALVAYELLSGVLPIDGKEPGSLLVQKVRKPAPTLSERTGTAYPPALEQLIARALSRTPDRRPPTAGAFIDELAKLAGVTLELAPAPRVEPPASPKSEAYRPSGSTPKHSHLVSGVALALLLVAGVGIVAWAPWSEDGIVANPLAPDEPRAREPEPIVPGPQIVVPTVPRQPPDDEPQRSSNLRPKPRAPRGGERDAGHAAALSREGSAALLHGRFARARDLFRAATQADATHAAAWRGLGLASERMGLAPEAARAYRRYLSLASGAHDAGRVRERLSQLER